MLRVEVTNGSARSRSSACSRWFISAARRCTSASAWPETVYAPTTSGCRRVVALSCAGVVLPVQNSSTNASVVQPIAAGSRTAVKPRMTPLDRSRSTRRLTAGADNATWAPISAYEARASPDNNATIRRSTSSICNTSPLARNNSGCLCLPSVPTLLIMQRMYLMCPPEYFSVTYSINAWMDTAVPVDTELAVKQWERLRETLVGLGHEVHVLVPLVGLPDQVFAANGGFCVDGTVY